RSAPPDTKPRASRGGTSRARLRHPVAAIPQVSHGRPPAHIAPSRRRKWEEAKLLLRPTWGIRSLAQQLPPLVLFSILSSSSQARTERWALSPHHQRRTQ